MGSQAVCGHCGTVLQHPGARCLHCGAAPSGGAREAAYGGPAGAPFGATGHRPRIRRSPALAATLALFPGLGHFYLGKPMKGAAYLLGAGGLEFLGFDLDLTAIGAVIGIPMELGGIALWIHGIVDAYRTAKRMEAGLE